MKFKILSVILCLALLLALCACTGDNEDIVSGGGTSSEMSSEVSSAVNAVTSSEVQSSSQASSSSAASNQALTMEAEEYLMTLVNPWNALPEGFTPKTTPIPAGYGTWANMSFADIGFNDLIAMMDDARSQGVNLILVSSTRTTAEQTALFDNKINRVMASDPSLSRDQAADIAATAVARPGTSEHQLGLAVDFNSTDDSFRNSKEFKWLQDHCTEYGFIYRYPDDKRSVTGIIPEPWHYRYVGKDNAVKIKASGLVLEEYLAQNS